MSEKFGNKIKFLKIIYIAKSLIKSEVFFFYAKNIQSINFDNKTERKGKQNFKKSVINCVGLTLLNKILDYMKKGGDIENLTPDNVFKK